MKLHSYWRSSAAFRVRIALGLKGLPFDTQPVHLTLGGGEQHGADYRALNPQELVPTLVAGEAVLTQSLAIIEYLEESYPEPALLPRSPVARARVRALALAIACEIHPLNNLRVLQYLGQSFGADEAAKATWYRHWLETGLAPLERQLAASAQTGRYCHGDQPGLADTCLVPQLYNARRYALDLAPYPTLLRIEAACLELPAFLAALPERQPDAP
ncbi:MAG: maleylacetoacetate isomerase [Burkholderiales bacterium]|nr:MAG: maleylacetoacetate isomerase [Burkholderiales bacterium]